MTGSQESGASHTGEDMKRDLIMVSGYYGFANLGDEAILEELIEELATLVDRDRIVVLSNNPESTRARFSVTSVNRWRLAEIVPLLGRTRLLVSGGGGLFQDTVSIKSVVYYAGLIFLARLRGARALVYAQGLGPLRGALARKLTAMAISRCAAVTVRDPSSQTLLESWGIPSVLSADPVWRLKTTPLPAEMAAALDDMRRLHSEGLFVGLSLRSSSGFGAAEAGKMADGLLESLPVETILLPLVLQENQDRDLLALVSNRWTEAGRKTLEFESMVFARLLPSQWLEFIGSLDLVVGMRLHSLIMALSRGVPVVGLSYDPKVEHVMREFEQPFLNLANGRDVESEVAGLPMLSELVIKAIEGRQELSGIARGRANAACELACQNFTILDKILSI
ncbi:MAG: polysaccharide pyruvyl transferase CsaB [Cyanobacteria bacterium HKST-UBA02]|nr:polysaccharide pyruvyl transferase CsaB [Cyanobacteria bacterium HKST-UBA02]